jgi:hypothetical protein
MNESDIIEIIKLLKRASKTADWNDVDEAIEYLQEHLDEYDDSEDY